MKIGIIGCGWLGFRLAKHLSSGNVIYTTSTTSEKVIDLGSYFHSFLVDFDRFELIRWNVLSDLDVIIITVPFKKQIDRILLDNRLKNIRNFIDGFEKQLFFTSSVGIYPAINAEIDEDFPSDSLQPTLLSVEKFFKSYFPQVTILRLGGLMGDNRIFSKYTVTDFHHAVNHVHYQDVCLAIETMIARKIHSQTYNIVAPKHPTKQEIINHQKGLNIALIESPSGKIVSAKKLENELNFEFSLPNPIDF